MATSVNRELIKTAHENDTHKNLTPIRRIGLSRNRKTPTIFNSPQMGTNVCSVNEANVKLTNEVKKLITTPTASNQLTPCRRIGLSRKRKTPLTNLKGELVETCMGVGDVSPLLDVTPVAHKDKLKRLKKHLDSENESDEIDIESNSRLESHEKFDSDDENDVYKKVKSKSKSKQGNDLVERDVRIKVTKNVKSKSKRVKSKLNGSTTNEAMDEKSLSGNVANVTSDCENVNQYDSECDSGVISNENSGSVQVDDEKGIIDEELAHNRKEIDSHSDEDLIIVRRKDSNYGNKIKASCKLESKFTSCVNLKERNNEVTTTCYNETSPNVHKNKSKLRKSLSLKKSISSYTLDLIESDDNSSPGRPITKDVSQCEVDENNPGVRTSKIKLVDNILELEKRIRDKEAHLAKLHHAEVYHNLHNLEELDDVTNVWKTGCQEALKDLLEKLKEHATINMSMLLLNLKVPDNLMRYNAEDDCFV